MFSNMFAVDTLIVFLLGVSLVHAIVSRTNITVSGVSSGAAMATQLHIAFSQDISGVGVLASPPYDCAGGILTAAECLTGTVTSISIPDIEKRIKAFESEGVIDSTSNMVGDPVYIFSGKYDPVVLQPIAKLNQELYSSFNTNIKTNYDLPATHGIPTVNYGEPCAKLSPPDFINKCNFSLVYDVLNHLYGGNLTQPDWSHGTPLVGQMILFNQEAFLNPPPELATGQVDATVAQWLWTYLALYDPVNWGWPTSGLANWTIPTTTTPNENEGMTLGNSFYSLDTKGFAYFPRACAKSQKCPIHIALHGCLQGKHYVGDIFETKTGYLEVAELNNLIILFPQVVPSVISPTNPMGCWDWWGYNTKQFATKLGPQMFSVKKMLDTLRLINNAIAVSA